MICGHELPQLSSASGSSVATRQTQNQGRGPRGRRAHTTVTTPAAGAADGGGAPTDAVGGGVTLASSSIPAVPRGADDCSVRSAMRESAAPRNRQQDSPRSQRDLQQNGDGGRLRR